MRLSDLTWAWSRAWRKWRFRIYAANKLPWAFALALGVAGALLSYAVQAVIEYKEDRRHVLCLALNIYHEARGEPVEGQYAVAEVTMNRVASPRYPNTVCEVVYQKNWDWIRKRYVGAFSWTEFDTMPSPKGEEWVRAWKIATEVYHQRHEPQLTQMALHYHAVYIKPRWAVGRKPITRIGRHVFYH